MKGSLLGGRNVAGSEASHWRVIIVKKLVVIAVSLLIIVVGLVSYSASNAGGIQSSLRDLHLHERAHQRVLHTLRAPHQRGNEEAVQLTERSHGSWR